ncbi:ATP-dependent Clp protease proteolytic subunit [Microbulbifer magnicolonia]|uniref:ATP-dependent Clp protease proteolytic subunit n=1 Tax=Microbulbifer magnicolonia TaxID=3109744 RepID=UPI002B40F147|nr:ATP-dependent Clp protease proteolytic subunit [Microbulbifer sp. GG15]
MRYLIIFLSFFVYTSASNGADIVERLGTPILKGEIAPGDANKLLSYLRDDRHSTVPAILRVNSPGGSVEEAIKIGEIVRDLMMTVHLNMDGVCYSACFFIYMFAHERNSALGKVGLHRTYFKKQYFSDLSFEKAQSVYQSAREKYGNILIDLGVPKHLIDKMYSQKSSDLYILSERELVDELGLKSEAFEEWIIASCGEMGAEENNDLWELGLGHYNLGDPPPEPLKGYKKYLYEKSSKIKSCRVGKISEAQEKGVLEHLPNSRAAKLISLLNPA